MSYVASQNIIKSYAKGGAEGGAGFKGDAMSRIKNKLTAKGVIAKKVPGYYPDGGNLYLRVSATLAKTWAFYYKKNGKRTELGLGSSR